MVKSKKLKDPFADREAQKYEHPIPSREFILEFLADHGRPATYQQLLNAFYLDSEETQEALRRRLIAMERDGQLHKNRRDAYGPVDKMELIKGCVIGHKDGFGFVVPDAGGEDLFLSPKEMRKVFHGDHVLTRVTNVDARGRREALVVEVLERNTKQVVGKVFIQSGAAFLEPSNPRIGRDILIPPDELHGAEHGQMVVAAIIEQPNRRTRAIGKVIEVLGDHMAPGMEITVAIHNHGIRYEWPEAALLEASAYSPDVSDEELEGREDLRDLPFVTIDGEDAKDFDDAVYCEPQGNGTWKLFVAIADVSHYVKPKSALDQEAYERGNSVYFPGRVIPMLPETLSNHLCSLNPKVDRLVMVCEMDIDSSGKIKKYHFMRAVIHSHARLTYYQVYRAMEKRDLRMREKFPDLVQQLVDLYDIYHVLHKAREKRGAIDFDMPETKIVFGKDRKIEKIVPYERFQSHRVIEECMLAANICAAGFVEKKAFPALYRVHKGPSEQKVYDLRTFLMEHGIKVPMHRDLTPSDYASILRVTQDRPDAQMIQTILLRSMSQAIYSAENKGHFGLAYDAYSHFTSPIRRYPDLIIHRVIKSIIDKKPKPSDANFIIKAGEHCSHTERRADDATGEAIDWLKCEFMVDKVGQEYAGKISGVTNFGIFVELEEVYVEGLIHISALPSDYYQFDPIKHKLTGDRSGCHFRLGDPIHIQVARVDLDQGEIDFVLSEQERLKYDFNGHKKLKVTQRAKKKVKDNDKHKKSKDKRGKDKKSKKSPRKRKRR